MIEQEPQSFQRAFGRFNLPLGRQEGIPLPPEGGQPPALFSVEKANELLCSRRELFLRGSKVVGGFVLGSALSSRAMAVTEPSGRALGPMPTLAATPTGLGAVTRQSIENILDAQGTIANGLYSVQINRTDITDVKLHGVPISPAFQINGTIFFQDLGNGRVIMNADMALKPKELDPFIGQLIRHNIVFQAEHQHFYDYTPEVWFIHFRAVGDPITIAQGIKAGLNVTSTPFPQKSTQNPKTPLPSQQIGEILGAKPTVVSGGVVTLDVPRKDPITLGGVLVNPYLNIASSIAFEPHGGGTKAAAVCDFALTASEINPLVGLMLGMGWDIGCLYNQETDEQPQLYFSHQFKVGEAVTLAHELRQGLEMTNSHFKQAT
jgi:hypothetical protein